ncbi:MAG: PadR family transcriptional regulator [Proteobacteria bacterium]|nr:MAG: PadR family transcriptional regulator [Pseudomonadota bacterium]
MQIKGHTELAVLRALQGKEMHGYAIVKLLQIIGVPELGGSEGTIYPLLVRLEKSGFVQSRWDEGRKLYSLSEGGLGQLSVRLEEWHNFQRGLNKFLHDGAGLPS